MPVALVLAFRYERATPWDFTKDIQSMDDLLLHGLQDIYYAEKEIPDG